MRIVELGDCSMTIMKDSEDPPWCSVGNIYRESMEKNRNIAVSKIGKDKDGFRRDIISISSEAVCTAGRLILFFKEPVDSRFKVQDRVSLYLSMFDY